MSTQDPSPCPSTVRHTRSMGDLPSPPPAIVLTPSASTPIAPQPSANSPTGLPVNNQLEPLQISHLPNSLSIAVLNHWNIQTAGSGVAGSPTTTQAGEAQPPTVSAYNSAGNHSFSIRYSKVGWFPCFRLWALAVAQHQRESPRCLFSGICVGASLRYVTYVKLIVNC